MSEPVRLAAVPSLDALAQDPAAFDSLPPAVQAERLEAVEVLAAHLRARTLTARAQAEPAQAAVPDRAVRIEEAEGLLCMSHDYVARHWKKLGGFKDVDGHVKFSLATIRQHVCRGGRP